MNNTMMRTLFALVGIAAVAAITVMILRSCSNKQQEAAPEEPQEKVTVVPYERPADASPITGVSCANYQKRPFAIMYSGDPEARVYHSGLSQADIVFEGPEQSKSDTRVMAIYQCNLPEAAGPMRSGRTDFLSIAGAYDAIFVPWGGSSISKKKLKEGVIDFIECNQEVSPAGNSTSCYRGNPGTYPVALEDRAFSNPSSLIAQAQEIGYRQETTLSAYEHQGELVESERPVFGKLSVRFKKPYRVHYAYDGATNTYQRYFNNAKDIDFATRQQVAPKNVVVIPAKAEHFRTDIDYGARGVSDPWTGIDAGHKAGEHDRYANLNFGDPWFDVDRSGPAHFYMNGQEVLGTWKRDKGIDKPYQFFDTSGAPIKFVPGQIWVELPEPGQTINWSAGDAEDRAEFEAELEERRTGIPAAAATPGA